MKRLRIPPTGAAIGLWLVLAGPSSEVKPVGAQGAGTSPLSHLYSIERQPIAGALAEVAGLAVGPAGDVYTIDPAGHRVLRYGPDGQLAGAWGRWGSGQGQFRFCCTYADQLQIPLGIDVDALGTVYVADLANHRIQRFDRLGRFRGVWGQYGSARGQLNAPVGVAALQDGTALVLESGNARVQRFTFDGRWLGGWSVNAACGAENTDPIGLAAAPGGSVFVSHSRRGARCIQRFNVAGDLLAEWQVEVLSSEAREFAGPIGLAAAADGSVYALTWSTGSAVMHFDAAGMLLERFGSGVTGGRSNFPAAGLDADGYGNVVVAAQGRLDRYPSSRRTAELLAAGRDALAYGALGGHVGLTSGFNGSIYAADTGNDRVQHFQPNGVFLGQVGHLPGAKLRQPADVAVDGLRNAYVADTGNDRVAVLAEDGRLVRSWGKSGSGEGEFSGPEGIAIADNGSVLVADTQNGRVQRFTALGEYLGQFAEWSGGALSRPTSLAFTADGRVMVTDNGKAPAVEVFSAEGVHLYRMGYYGPTDGQYRLPADLASGPSGVVVADSAGDRVVPFDVCARPLTSWGLPGLGPGEFRTPSGVAIGLRGELYVAEEGSRRIQRFDSQGRPSGVWGGYGEPYNPGSPIFEGEGELGPDAYFDVAPDGTMLVVSGYPTYRVQVLRRDGSFNDQWSLYHRALGQVAGVDAIAIGRGTDLYVADTGDDLVRIYRLYGQFVDSWPLVDGSGNTAPYVYDLAVGSDGTVLAATADAVWRWKSDGQFLGAWGGWQTSDGPRGIAAGPLGDIYTTQRGSVRRYSPSGELLKEWGSRGRGPGQFQGDCESCGLYIAVAPDATVLVGDWGNQVIHRFDREGNYIDRIASPEPYRTDAGPWTFVGQLGVAEDGTIFSAGRDRVYVMGAESDATWRVSYYGDRWLSERPLAIEHATEIDYAWGDIAVAPDLPHDQTSVRAERILSPSEDWRVIDLRTLGGARLWVDDALVVDDWDASSVAESAVLAPNRQYRVVAEYNDRSGPARFRVAVRSTVAPQLLFLPTLGQ